VLAWLLTRWRPDGEPARTWVRTGTTAFVLVLLCSTSVYGALALSDHAAAADGDATLDGTAHLERSHPAEAEAIRWLDDREGRPVIVTAAPASYNWNPSEGEGASAPASLTGLPTVAGWSHEAQYRNDSVYDERVDHVEAIYTGSEAQQRALVERYDVRYIYVGPVERASYDEVTVDRFGGARPVHRSGDVVIYRVDGT
jgi:uncharacterized membrane protein